jgi:hypothetical protein
MPPKTPKKDTSGNIPKQQGGSKQAHEVQWRQRAIRIYFDTEGRVNPPDVEQLTETFKEQDRPIGPETPSAKQALATVREYYKHSEDEAFAELSHLLTEASEDLNKAAGIRKVMKRPWQAGCVPFLEEADDATRKLFATYYPTSTPKPDLAYGFHFGPEADETDILDNSPNLRQILDICRIIHFPFLIIEWKSTWFGGNMADAQNQLARAGASAVHVMDRLHRHSGNANPTSADTCVFSMGIDNNVVLFHVHWRGVNRRGQAFTEMRIFEAVTLLKHGDLRQLRRVVFNIFQWARNVRLPAVKACVAKLDPNKPTPAILHDPTDSEAQTQSDPGAPTIQTDEGIGSSASSAFAVPESPHSSHKTPLAQPGTLVAPGTAPTEFRGRQLSESPSALAKYKSSKRLRVEYIME